MARPKADQDKVARALAAHAKGLPLAQAATKHGVSKRTLDRAIAAASTKTPSAPVAASSSPPIVQVQVGVPAAVAPPAEPEGPGLVLDLLAEVDALLRTLPDLPEARVVGAALRVVAGELKSGVDPSKLPAIINAVRSATLTVREMRGPIAPTRDQVDERLRQLDGVSRRRHEQYTAAADAALDRRLAELRAWLLGWLPPAIAPELHQRLDALFAPPEVPT